MEGAAPLIPAEASRTLLVLVIFLLPGFVTLLFKERTHEEGGPVPAFERLLQTLYYSLLVYLPLTLAAAVAGWNVDQIERTYDGSEGLWALLGVAALSGLALPALIAYAGAQWAGSFQRPTVLKRLGLRPAHRTPSAWDHFFGIELPAFVRVTTRSGAVLGGYFGTLSFAGYGRQERARDFYLEEQWELDEVTYAFVKPFEWSLGVWIDGSDIVSLEFVAVSEEEADAFKEVAESGNGD